MGFFIRNICFIGFVCGLFFCFLLALVIMGDLVILLFLYGACRWSGYEIRRYGRVIWKNIEREVETRREMWR